MPLVWALVAWLALGLVVAMVVGPALRRAAPPADAADRAPGHSPGERPAA